MTTATAPAPTPATAQPKPAGLIALLDHIRPGQRLLLTDVSWAEYLRLLEDQAAAGRKVRVTFYRGELEIMVTGNTHERLKKIVALLVEAWMEETGIEYLPSGEMTHHRDDAEVGFQPDECYYVQNWAKVAGLRDIDFAKDPPPDLAVEIEVSRTLLSRLPIYAAFKIPEAWRYNGKKLTVLLLQPDGTYQESPTSRAIPTFPFAEVPRFLALAADISTSFTAIGRQFRAWVRSLPPAANP